MFKRLLLNDSFILALILINAIVVIILGNPELNDQTRGFLLLTDVFLTIVFVIEAIVKIRVLSPARFFASSWNVFDFVVIMLAGISLLASFVIVEFGGLSFLLVLRITRVFRVIRTLRIIPNASELIAGVKRALRTSVAVLIALGVYLLVLGVLSFSLFADMSPEYFGTPLKAIYAVFRLFTIEGWFDIPDALTVNTSGTITILINVYFSVVMFTGGILGMSLVNSIFVDAMVADNNQDLERKITHLSDQIQTLEEKIDSLISNK